MSKHSFQYRVALYIERCLIETKHLQFDNFEIAFIGNLFDFSSFLTST